MARKTLAAPGADGRVHFTLQGGKWAGLSYLFLPDNPREHRQGMQPIYPPVFMLAGERYELPDTDRQTPSKPFYEWKPQ